MSTINDIDKIKYEDAFYTPHQTFWKQHLPGYSAAFVYRQKNFENLGAESNRLSCHSFEISHAAYSRLMHMVKGSDAGLFNCILSAVGVLFSRYSGQPHITIDSPLLRIALSEEAFGETVPLLMEASSSYTLREYLNKVQEGIGKCYKYQDYPLHLIEPDADLYHSNIFIQYTSIHAATHDLKKYDLIIGIERSEAAIGIKLEYREKYFDTFFIQKIQQHLESVFTYIADLNTSLKNIDILSGEEHRLLSSFNASSMSYPKDRSLALLFEEQADRTPEAMAVSCEGVTLTYRQLNEEANKLAFYLKEQSGIQPGEIVGIMADRSERLVIGILAVIKAGGAYLPIDPQLPEERKQHMTEEAEIKVLLTDSYYLFDIAFFKEEIFALDIQLPVLQEGTGNLPATYSSDSLAYVIYTSGSTGNPKGVMVKHRSLINLCCWHNRNFNVSEHSRATLYANIGFDAAVWELWPYLLTGACLYPLQEDLKLHLEELAGFLNRNKITHCFLPTPVCSALQHLNLSIDRDLLMLTGGDELHFNSDNGLNIVNNYGPTESTVVATSMYLKDNAHNPLLPIGKPIDNTRVYILDKELRQVPVGITGELFIAGDGLAAGYLKRETMNREKFIRSPFDEDAGSPMYSTGDLGCWLQDGHILFRGRLDSQVKIRGYRVELGEIENAIKQHQGVKDALVYTTGAQQEKSLAAVVIPSGKDDSNAGWDSPESLIKSIQKLCSEKLPEYMVPAFMNCLDAFPLTRNGKVDRKHLPTPQNSVAKVPAMAPGNEIETLLLEIWKRVLGRPEIGITDSFFDTGGDSIKAIQISAAMHKRGYKIEVRDIFYHLKIQSLATAVQTLEHISDQSAITGEVPLTPVQKAFFSHSTDHVHHYNQSVMIYAEEGFQEDALLAVFGKLMEHHDALRMTFRRGPDNKIVQWNNNTGTPVSLQVMDLREEPEAASILESEAQRLQSGINLEQGPLMKLGLFKHKDGDRLLIVVHHLVVDAVSWRILFEDMETLFSQYKKGEALLLPAKTDAFKVWAEQLQQYADSTAFLKEKDYWAALEALEVPRLIPDQADGDNCVRDVEAVSFTLDQTDTALLLNKVHRVYHTEINDILLTGLGMAVKAFTGNALVSIAMEGHGRENVLEGVNISRTIGWFSSIYPLVLDMSHSDDLSRQIRFVKEQMHNVPDKGIGYGILRYLTSPGNKTGWSFNLQPQISFNYLGQFDSDLAARSYRIANENAGDNISGERKRDYDLEVMGMVRDQQLHMSLLFSKNQYSKDRVRELCEAFRKSLTEIIAHCSTQTVSIKTPSDFTYRNLSSGTVEALCRKYDLEDICELSPMQSGMFFHCVLEREKLSYFEQVSYRTKGPFDPVLLEQSLKELFIRHEVLRTAFLSEGVEHPVQVIFRDRLAVLHYHDITSITQEGQEEYIKAYKEKDRSRNFDLSNDGLLRLCVMATGQDEYVFIWSFHHILMDGWCIGILYNEFLEIYRCLSHGIPVSLPPVASYKEYLLWLRKQDKEASGSYWSNYVKHYEGIQGFPKRSVRKEGYSKASETLHLGRERTKKLQSLVARNQVTINTFLQTAWGLLAARYNGTDEVIFGSVVSGRPANIKGVDHMVGLFINTIPVRVAYRQGMKFSGLLRNIQEEALRSETHHYYPLSDIQSSSPLGPKLIDHLYVFENYPIEAHLGRPEDNEPEVHAGRKITDLQVFEQSNYDFNVISGIGDELIVRLDYNECIYEPEMIRSLTRYLENIIDQVLADEQAEVSSIDLLTGEERKALLAQSVSPARRYPKDKTIHHLFEAQVIRSPEATALVCDGRRISYKELNEKSNQLAHYLRANYGLRPDDLIAISAERTERMLIGLLAILKSGAAYVPVDPAYPQERKRLMLEDCQVKAVLADGLEFVQEKNSIMLQEVLEQIQDYPVHNLEEINSSGSLAYVIYTSGSTGVPKGVMVNHLSVVRLVIDPDYIQLSGADKLIPTGSLSFDASTFEIWGMLLNGGTLYLHDPDTILSPQLLGKSLKEEEISVLWLTSSLFNELCEGSASMFSGLKYLLVGGDRLSVKHINKVREANPSLRIINGYGPTENTTFSICQEIKETYTASVPVGVPVSGSSAYILDNQLQPVPAGATGEIYVGGDGLARGYLNKEALTAEKFIPHPFIAGERLYKTGDLGRWLPDGVIEFIGRKDNQVKIRGFRIEPGEIEHVLQQQEGIEQAVLVAFENKDKEKFLVAYYTTSGNVTETMLRSRLVSILPSYMLPSCFLKLQAIPLTSNGKVDKRALPLPDEEASGAVYVAAGNKTEEKLVQIWEEVLGRTNIGIRDNFFESGGHSLKAMQVVARIGKELNVQVDLKQIFVHPTIESLARSLEEAGSSLFVSIPQAEEAPYYELSHGQKRLWVLSQFEDSRLAYHMPGAYELKGSLDVASFEKAFAALIERHEILRTTFITVNGIPRQKINKPEASGFVLAQKDLSEEADKETLCWQLCKEASEEPFDLEKGPLLRALLIRLEADRYLLSFTMHHIIADGWSMEVLVKDVLHLYKRFREGKTGNLVPLNIQYKDYAAWQRRELSGSRLERHRSYWHEQFKGTLPVLELPADYTRPAVKTYNGDLVSFILSEDICKKLQEISQRKGASLFMTLLASIKVLLHRYSGQEDIILGSPMAGRHHKELENQIGFYVNTLALRTRFTGKNSFEEILYKVKDTILNAYDHQAYPIDLLIDELSVIRDTSRSPLFEAGFTWHTTAYSEETPSGDLEVKLHQLHNRTAKADLWFHAREVKEHVYFAIEYNTDLFKESTIRRLTEHYRILLSSLTENPDLPVHQLEFLTREENTLLLEGYNSTDAVFPSDITMQELFEEQVAKFPESEALVFEDRCLTYQELNALTNRLARHIRSGFSVKPDEVVGIMLPKSELVIVGILGILKSGAAYLPIDPDYPKERIRFMLEDAKVKLLLTHSDLLYALGDYSGDLMALDLQLESLEESDAHVPVINKPTDVAYVIYTSGSTGLPKGVMIEHRSNVNMALDQIARFGITHRDRVLQFASLSFDASVYEMTMAMYAGATLVVTDKNRIRDAEAFPAFLERNGVSVVTLPPAYLRLLSIDKLHFLRVIITAGEAADVRQATGCSEFADYYNAYGPTECAVCVSVYKVSREDIQRERIPIGRPLSNTKIYILDEYHNLVPPGVEGEIVVSGVNLARGYLGQPVLTGQRFVESPFEPGERLYKTGDKGRWLEGGNIEFSGRKDDQVKIRGHRVEPGEVESVLLQYEGIGQATVVVRQIHQEKELVAYYTVDRTSGQGKEVPKEGLRNYIAGKLPEYMLPALFMELEEIPVTINGKVDKNALPDPAGEVSECTYEAPKSYTEERLVQIWQEVLGRAQIGVKDNFFTSGGDSIKAIRMVSMVNKALGKDLDIKEVFQYQTIASLSAIIENSDRSDYDARVAQAHSALEHLRLSITMDTALAAALPPDIEDIYPVSDIQKGMLFHSALDLDSGIYHDQMYFQFEDTAFDFELFKTAFSLLADKHVILRTSFHMTGFGQPVQFVHSGIRENLFYDDISAMGANAQHIYLDAFLAEDRQNPFDPEVAGLWRVKVVKLHEAEYGVFLICHHAILDGWSVASLQTELSNVYYTLKEDPSYRPQPLRCTYKDFITDQWIAGNQPGSRAFWSNYLKGYTRTSLPLNKEVDLSKVRKIFREYTCPVDKELSASLQEMSARMLVNIKDIYLAAFACFLKLTTNTDDVTLGLVSNARPAVEDGDRMIGCFLNTIPFRIRFKDPLTTEDLIASVKNTISEVKGHDKLSFMEIAAAIGETRGLHNPVYDLFFNYLHYHIFSESHSRVRLKESPVHHLTSNTNTYFNFTVFRSGDSFNIIIHYLADLYEEEEMERLTRYYHGILKAFVNNAASVAIRSEDIIGEHEKHRLFHQFNNTKRAYPAVTLHGLFEQQAERTPNAAAVTGRQTFTYGELNKYSNQLAHYMRERYRITGNDLIGIIADRTERMLIGILAILKSGAGYVPIDPAYPEERIKYMLSDSNSKLVLTDTDSYAPEGPVHARRLTDLLNEAGAYPETNPSTINKPDDLAYVIYTSGSTGIPKGVMIEHHNVVAFLDWAAEEFSRSEFELVYACTSYCFDLSIFELFYPLSIGSRIRILSHGLDAKQFFGTDKKVLFNTVPSVVESLLREGEDLSSVSVLNMAGEPIPFFIKESLDCSRMEIRNLYGPSEDTTYSTCYRFRKSDSIIPIGKPIFNTEVLILDEKQQLLPIGVTGEICIAGEGLARGYLNKEELTREKFIVHPYRKGERLYRTGDLGRWTPEGVLEFLGRKDSQIKLRGYRIELGEIEQALDKQEGIVKSLVAVQEDSQNARHLIAYLVASGEINTDGLRSSLSRHLPFYMIPAHFVYLDAFPLTPNGKIDRKALMHSIEPANPASYIAPANATEEQLAIIWKEVLEKDRISIRDNFFELGGHSLKAIQVISRIYRELHVRLELKTLFLHPSIEALAAVIARSGVMAYNSIPVIPEAAYYDLSHAQKRLWVHEQFNGRSAAYNIPGAYELKGHLDIESFSHAFDVLMERHEILRTNFVVIDGQPKQKVNKDGQNVFSLEYVDLSSEPDRESMTKRMCEEQSKTVFDLTEGLLFKGLLIRQQQDHHVFSFTMHHIISDGWSLEIIVREVLHCYNHFVKGEAHRLLPLKIQYKDFAHWQNQELSGENMRRYKAYWHALFNDEIPVLRLPADHPRPARKTYNGREITFKLSKEISDQLLAYGRKKGASLFMVLLAGIKSLLYKYTGQEDIIVGTPTAGRVHHDLENQIGFYLNSLPLRTRFSAGQSFETLLEKVKEVTLGAFEHQVYPYDLLVDELLKERDLSRSPLFDVLVILQNFGSAQNKDHAVENLTISPCRIDSTVSAYDLTICFNEDTDGIAVSLVYNTDLIRPSTMEDMQQNLCHLMNAVVSDPSVQIRNIPLLDAPDRQQEADAFMKLMENL